MLTGGTFAPCRAVVGVDGALSERLPARATLLLLEGRWPEPGLGVERALKGSCGDPATGPHPEYTASFVKL